MGGGERNLRSRKWKRWSRKKLGDRAPGQLELAPALTPLPLLS